LPVGSCLAVTGSVAKLAIPATVGIVLASVRCRRIVGIINGPPPTHPGTLPMIANCVFRGQSAWLRGGCLGAAPRHAPPPSGNTYRRLPGGQRCSVSGVKTPPFPYVFGTLTAGALTVPPAVCARAGTALPMPHARTAATESTPSIAKNFRFMTFFHLVESGSILLRRHIRTTNKSFRHPDRRLPEWRDRASLCEALPRIAVLALKPHGPSDQKQAAEDQRGLRCETIVEARRGRRAIPPLRSG